MENMRKPWYWIQEQGWCSQRSGVKDIIWINIGFPDRDDNMCACIQQKRQGFYSSAFDATICFNLIYDIYVGFESIEHAMGWSKPYKKKEGCQSQSRERLCASNGNSYL